MFVETNPYENIKLIGVDLSGIDLSNKNLSGIDLTNTNLTGANLSGANLSGSILKYTDFTNANLKNADLNHSDLENADLYNADLENADLTFCKLQHTSFVLTKMYNTHINHSIINCTDFTRALIDFVPIIISGSPWNVIMYNKNAVKIGCQTHSLQRWLDRGGDIAYFCGESEIWEEEYGVIIEFLAYEHDISRKEKG